MQAVHAISKAIPAIPDTNPSNNRHYVSTMLSPTLKKDTRLPFKQIHKKRLQLNASATSSWKSGNRSYKHAFDFSTLEIELALT